MAEYIDRNLIEWYGCNYENTACENRECSDCHLAECSQSQVMQIPTADVIERSKIDKAIEEISKLPTWGGNLDVSPKEVVEIIKRNIGE